MRASDKKEYIVVAVIFIFAVVIFSYISQNHPDIIRENPEQAMVLHQSDMTVATSSGILMVGKTTRAEAMLVFPEGENLGRSGLYRPKDLDCLLSFSKKEDVLIRIDLGQCDLSTSRGIKVNDSFDKVLAQYGNGFTKAYDKTTPQIFDAYYGADQYILFKIENNMVKQIYIGSPVL
ncbi:MAG: hypothetical protein VB084_11830 [Syntrophomonadaceae bacterium]|nr:hypothetical protein [Syntrophomonadaceae bacterium]